MKAFWLLKLNALWLLKLNVVAFMAAIVYRVTMPLIPIILKKRHPSLLASVPSNPNSGIPGFLSEWQRSRYLFWFVGTGQFIALKDAWLTALCIVAATTYVVTMICISTLMYKILQVLLVMYGGG
jgi:hypothetical protein